ncbi:cadmium resistance transporter [Weissella halotolerans]|uniref:Cadmium resistance transporter n=1 Tax=Weissella halotolerans DSM 20190 TaxID=1123500 RepID=A0A0R2G2M1_9LACO|nr:cadmium resistance transporter [Weissella halotolerans]KRN32501.1 hypothetical protein IV68_GL000856 [Weissella halotolerans DSM 20190]
MGYLISALMAYVGSNLDDLVLVTLFYAQARTKKQKVNVVLAQFVVLTLVFVGSAFIAVALQQFHLSHLNLLGVIPLGLGLYSLAQYLRDREYRSTKSSESKINQVTFMEVFGITLANCGDNVGVYIPLFSNYSMSQLMVVVGMFIMLIFVWQLLGRWIADLPAVKQVILKYQSILMPTLLIILGIMILMG